MIILRQESFSSKGGKKDNSGKVALGVGGSAAALGAGIGAWKGGDTAILLALNHDLKEEFIKRNINNGISKKNARKALKKELSGLKEELKDIGWKEKWNANNNTFRKGTALGTLSGLAAGTAVGLGTYAYMKNKNKKE